MKCEECHGLGHVVNLAALKRLSSAIKAIDFTPLPRGALMLRCPSCGGSGISSCCEGAVGLAGDVTNNA